MRGSAAQWLMLITLFLLIVYRIMGSLLHAPQTHRHAHETHFFACLPHAIIRLIGFPGADGGSVSGSSDALLARPLRLPKL